MKWTFKNYLGKEESWYSKDVIDKLKMIIFDITTYNCCDGCPIKETYCAEHYKECEMECEEVVNHWVDSITEE